VAVSGAAVVRNLAPRRRIRRVSNWDILPLVLGSAVRRAVADPGRFRAGPLKHLWIELKRFGAPHVVDVELSRIDGIERVQVDGRVLRHSPLVLGALAVLLECETIFEFGTYRGDTTHLLAHNLPKSRVFTLDLPGPDAIPSAQLELTDHDEYFRDWDRGVRFRGTPEADRITQLVGDSATFDFSPYRGTIDLVYVDASHSYSYVRSDTEAALTMLSASGTIVWDDYTHYPGIYAYLNELASVLDRPILHVLGTRLAVYSRRDLVGLGRA
jgi:predicted O-methyltransferase YrrM